MKKTSSKGSSFFYRPKNGPKPEVLVESYNPKPRITDAKYARMHQSFPSNISSSLESEPVRVSKPRIVTKKPREVVTDSKNRLCKKGSEVQSCSVSSLSASVYDERKYAEPGKVFVKTSDLNEIYTDLYKYRKELLRAGVRKRNSVLTVDQTSISQINDETRNVPDDIKLPTQKEAITDDNKLLSQQLTSIKPQSKQEIVPPEVQFQDAEPKPTSNIPLLENTPELKFQDAELLLREAEEQLEEIEVEIKNSSISTELLASKCSDDEKLHVHFLIEKYIRPSQSEEVEPSYPMQNEIVTELDQHKHYNSFATDLNLPDTIPKAEKLKKRHVKLQTNLRKTFQNRESQSEPIPEFSKPTLTIQKLPSINVKSEFEKPNNVGLFTMEYLTTPEFQAGDSLVPISENLTTNEVWICHDNSTSETPKETEESRDEIIINSEKIQKISPKRVSIDERVLTKPSNRPEVSQIKKFSQQCQENVENLVRMIDSLCEKSSSFKEPTVDYLVDKIEKQVLVHGEDQTISDSYQSHPIGSTLNPRKGKCNLMYFEDLLQEGSSEISKPSTAPSFQTNKSTALTKSPLFPKPKDSTDDPSQLSSYDPKEASSKYYDASSESANLNSKMGIMKSKARKKKKSVSISTEFNATEENLLVHHFTNPGALSPMSIFNDPVAPELEKAGNKVLAKDLSLFYLQHTEKSSEISTAVGQPKIKDAELCQRGSQTSPTVVTNVSSQTKPQSCDKFTTLEEIKQPSFPDSVVSEKLLFIVDADGKSVDLIKDLIERVTPPVSRGTGSILVVSEGTIVTLNTEDDIQVYVNRLSQRRNRKMLQFEKSMLTNNEQRENVFTMENQPEKSIDSVTLNEKSVLDLSAAKSPKPKPSLKISPNEVPAEKSPHKHQPDYEVNKICAELKKSIQDIASAMEPQIVPHISDAYRIFSNEFLAHNIAKVLPPATSSIKSDASSIDLHVPVRRPKKKRRSVHYQKSGRDSYKLSDGEVPKKCNCCYCSPGEVNSCQETSVGEVSRQVQMVQEDNPDLKIVRTRRRGTDWWRTFYVEPK